MNSDNALLFLVLVPAQLKLAYPHYTASCCAVQTCPGKSALGSKAEGFAGLGRILYKSLNSNGSSSIQTFRTCPQSVQHFRHF